MEQVIKATHDAGFFSVCNINLITVLDYFNKNQRFCKLDTSNQWNLYRDKNEDVYNRYFKYSSDYFYTTPQKYLDSDTEIQFSDYKKINYSFINPFIKKYFNLSDEVENLKNYLLTKYSIDLANTISVYYRGNDKSKETNLPSYAEFTNRLKNIKKLYPGHQILIQSDEYEFYEHCKNLNIDIIYFKEISKINKTDYTGVHYTIETENRIKTAQIFLAIVSIMSQSKIVILNSSNVSLFVCLFRGHANDVHQFYSPINSNNIFWY